MRHDAIYQDLNPAHPEHWLIGTPVRQLDILEAVRKAVPSALALNYCPDNVLGRTFAYISVRKTAADDGRRAAHTALAADPYVNMAVAVDDDIDVFDERDVLWALATRAQGRDSIDFFEAEGKAARLVVALTRPVGAPALLRTPRLSASGLAAASPGAARSNSRKS